jgi:hypothetical protein
MSEHLEALSRHDLAPPASANPGRPPAMEWVAISKLRIDPSYQRPVTSRGRNTIATIVQHFRWARFSPLIVARVPGKAGLFTIIDGQHRASAALICGYDRVPCCIVDVPPEEAAKVFAAVNGTVTPMSILSLYKAALVAKEAWALEVKEACEAGGIEALFYPVPKSKMKPFQTLAIGTLRKNIMRHGVAVVGQCIKAEARKAEAREPGWFNSAVIEQAIARRAETSRKEPPRLYAPEGASPVSISERVRAMKARGHSRSAITAATGLKYAEIEAILNGDRT